MYIWLPPLPDDSVADKCGLGTSFSGSWVQSNGPAKKFTVSVHELHTEFVKSAKVQMTPVVGPWAGNCIHDTTTNPIINIGDASGAEVSRRQQQQLSLHMAKPC